MSRKWGRSGRLCSGAFEVVVTLSSRPYGGVIGLCNVNVADVGLTVKDS